MYDVMCVCVCVCVDLPLPMILGGECCVVYV